MSRILYGGQKLGVPFLSGALRELEDNESSRDFKGKQNVRLISC